MAFLTVDETGKTIRTPKKKEGKRQYATGIVYLIKMELDCGTTVIKIGVTGRKFVVERLSENLMSFFQKFRYVPRTTMLKFSRCGDYFGAETALHKMYVDTKFSFEEEFQGCTEYFCIKDEEKLKDDYDKILKEYKDKPGKTTYVPEEIICPISGEPV